MLKFMEKVDVALETAVEVVFAGVCVTVVFVGAHNFYVLTNLVA